MVISRRRLPSKGACHATAPRGARGGKVTLQASRPTPCDLPRMVAASCPGESTLSTGFHGFELIWPSCRRRPVSIGLSGGRRRIQCCHQKYYAGVSAVPRRRGRPALARYIAVRLVSLIFTLVVVSLVTFLLMRAVPGDPWATGEHELPKPTQEAREQKYGLDDPIMVQYGRYMWNVLHGDFGVPFQSPTRTVTELIAATWPVTIRIGLLTIAFSFSFGILFGFIGAIRHNTWLDYAITLGASLGYVVPNFVIAVWLVL